jgi:hypothetical protein
MFLSLFVLVQPLHYFVQFVIPAEVGIHRSRDVTGSLLSQG